MITLGKVKGLQQESKNILGVFENAVTRLRAVNEKIEKAKFARVEKIDKLQEEVDALVSAETKNDKLATRLNDFLEV